MAGKITTLAIILLVWLMANLSWAQTIMLPDGRVVTCIQQGNVVVCY
jgi:hypothetical protein